MQKFRLIQWCDEATRLIRFGPDRRKVWNELMDHLVDRRDTLMEQGMEEREAIDKTLEAMGEAWKIAGPLAQIHKPFWGYLGRISKILLAILLVFSINPIWDYLNQWVLNFVPSNKEGFLVYDSSFYGGDTGRELIHLSRPDESFTIDGTKFTLASAAVYTEYSEHEKRDVTRLYVMIQEKSPLPVLEQKSYMGLYYQIPDYFNARDSLGNEYPGLANRTQPDETSLISDNAQIGLFTSLHTCWVNDFPPDAQWVELSYTRDGRDFSIRIDLTGGDHT